MSTPILTTKLHIPQPRPELVPRPRLVKRLNAGLQGKVTLISAPAGYGKTTLVSEWIAQSNFPVAWLSLDATNNDLAVFLAYFIAALQQIQEGVGSDILNTLKSSRSPQADALFTMLVNEIAAKEGGESHTREFAVILDDYHVITDQSINDGLEFFLENQPSRMHLSIIGRTDPPIPLSRLRVGGQLTEIRSDDLRFSHDEVVSFFNDLMDLDLPPQDLAALERRTEGWVAGLQLAALSLQGRADKHEFVEAFSGTHYHIIDYLVEEVLSRHPPVIRDFLCRTSILERLSTPLCNAVLETSNSRQILKQLEKTNLFLIPLDTTRHWYRYHHLFSEFLRLCLYERQYDDVPDLHRRAAGWYEQKGYIADAISHLLAAEDYAKATRVVENNARRMLDHSELSTMMRWVDALPDEYICANPKLCVYHAWALRLSGAPYASVESRLHTVERVLEEKAVPQPQSNSETEIALRDEEASVLRGHVMALRAFQALFRDDIPCVLEFAEEAKTYRLEESFVRSSIEFALGWAYRFSGGLKAADDAFAACEAISLASDNLYMAVAARCRAAYGHVLGGQLHRSLTSLQYAVDMATTEDRRLLPVAGYAYIYMGILYYEWDDLETAEHYLLRGLELCKRVGYFMDQVVGYTTVARVKLAQGDLAGAHVACQDAQRLSLMMKGYLYAQRWVEDCQLRLWRAQGNIDAIARWVEVCGLAIEDDLSFMRDIEHIILARALIALGRERSDRSSIVQATALLVRLRAMTETAGWKGKLLEVLTLQALAAQVLGDENGALHSLERALSLAEPERYIRTFVDEGEAMRALLHRAASRGIAVDYTGELLKAFAVNDDKTLIPLDPLQEPLSERELEVLRLLATDLSGPEIAEELFVALSTVRYHTNNIYSKLAVHKRRSAVRRAEELGLI